MSDGTPLLRQWSLLMALSARRLGMTVAEMADETGVKPRTIRRDLATLQQVGFPLQETVSDHGRKHWRIIEDRAKPAMSFNWAEAAALYLGRRFLEPLAGTHLWDGAQSALRKIRATLGDPAVRHLGKIAGAFHQTHTRLGDYTRKAEIIDSLMLAVEDGRIAFLTYQSMRATEPVTYDVYPLGLVWYKDALYLVAHAVQHEEIRHYKVDRISAVEVNCLKFVRPDGFDLEAHLRDSFGIFRGTGRRVRIEVRFSAEVARYVEESQWHASQQLARRPDGSLLFQVELGDTDEIKKWLLSFGAHAVVLKPNTLRQDMLAEIDRMRAAYATPKQHPPAARRANRSKKP